MPVLSVVDAADALSITFTVDTGWPADTGAE